jgi:RHS repeat-associated protein
MNFQYTGRENDSNGLYYYRDRYYSPVLGRFVNEDPLGFGGGINFYAYVGDDPTNFNDPFGLQRKGKGSTVVAPPPPVAVPPVPAPAPPPRLAPVPEPLPAEPEPGAGAGSFCTRFPGICGLALVFVPLKPVPRCDDEILSRRETVVGSAPASARHRARSDTKIDTSTAARCSEAGRKEKAQFV